jgi:hypothetical protein
MDLSPPTSSLLASLEAFSGHALTRAADLGMLLELAHRSGHREAFDELSFLAKFLSRIFRMMKRVGNTGTGYDTLSAEFGESLHTVTEMIRQQLHSAPKEEEVRWSREYLARTPEAMENLLALCSDLSWYKNWKLDHP